MTYRKANGSIEGPSDQIVAAGSAQANPAMRINANAAVDLLRALSHASRLTILRHLMEREYSVSELERLLGERQSATSQHLARLRADGLVTFRRQGKTLIYSISDDKTKSTVAHLHRLFCQNPG